MMQFAQAEKAFHKKYPKRVIMGAADLDDKRYVVIAQENPKEPDWADPTFTIDKRTGKVFQISGDLDEIDRINEAFDKRKIK